MPADPEKGFFFPYILRVPHSTSHPADFKSWIVVESNNDPFSATSPALERSVWRTMCGNDGVGVYIAARLGSAVLMPVFPRTVDGRWDFFLHQLDRCSRGRLSHLCGFMIEHARDFGLKYALIGKVSCVFSNTIGYRDKPQFRRVDLQLLAMVEHARWHTLFNTCMMRCPRCCHRCLVAVSTV